MRKQSKIWLSVFIGLLVIGAIFYFSTKQTFLGTGSNFVELPYFATVQCIQSQVSSPNVQIPIPQNGGWITDSFSSNMRNTNQWSITLQVPQNKCSFLQTPILEYYVAQQDNFNNVITHQKVNLNSPIFVRGILSVWVSLHPIY